VKVHSGFAGYFSEQLIPDDRVELPEIIDRYHWEHLPLRAAHVDPALCTQAQRGISDGPDLSGSAPGRAESVEPTLMPIKRSERMYAIV
jgi:hypothetical protein